MFGCSWHRCRIYIKLAVRVSYPESDVGQELPVGGSLDVDVSLDVGGCSDALDVGVVAAAVVVAAAARLPAAAKDFLDHGDVKDAWTNAAKHVVRGRGFESRANLL